MSFEHPNRNNESIRDVERDIMRRPPEHNTTNLDLDRMNLMLDVLGHPEHSFRVIHVTARTARGRPPAWPRPSAGRMGCAPACIRRRIWNVSTSASPSTGRS